MRFISVEMLPGHTQVWLDPNKVMVYKIVTLDPKAPVGSKTLVLMDGGVPFYLADEWKDLHSRLNVQPIAVPA